MLVVVMMMMTTMMRRMMVMVMMMIACDFNDGYDDNDQRFHDDGDGCHRGDDCFHDGDGGVGDDDDDGVKMMLVMLIMVNWWPRLHVHLLIYIYISLYAEQTVRPIQFTILWCLLANPLVLGTLLFLPILLSVCDGNVVHLHFSLKFPSVG